MTDNRKAEAMTAPLAQNNLLSVVDRNEHRQALGQAAFWRPRHAEASPVLGQVPFLFWLAELTSSRLIVQMGLDDGIAYLALCQAAERLSGNAICLALDTEEAPLTPALQAEHDWHYSDFSQIISGDKAVASLPEGIDFLVIAAPLERDGWDLLRDSVLPRLSNSAVLVVINPDAMLADQTALRTLTSAGQLHLSLQPVVSGGAAIDVILYGVKQPEQLRSLAGQPGRLSWLAMRQAFNRLGQGIVATCQNRDLLRDKEVWQDRLKQAEAKLETLKAEVENAEASEKVQHHRQAEMAARVHDLQRSISQAEDARNALQIERDALAAQLAEMQCAVEDARAEHDARIEDIVVLTAAYEDKRKQAENQFKARLAEKTQRVAALQRDLAEVSAHRNALLASTSWKITSPLRKVTKFVRGH